MDHTRRTARDEGLVDMRRRRGIIVREAAEARRVGMARDQVLALLEEVM